MPPAGGLLIKVIKGGDAAVETTVELRPPLGMRRLPKPGHDLFMSGSLSATATATAVRPVSTEAWETANMGRKGVGVRLAQRNDNRADTRT